MIDNDDCDLPTQAEVKAALQSLFRGAGPLVLEVALEGNWPGIDV